MQHEQSMYSNATHIKYAAILTTQTIRRIPLSGTLKWAICGYTNRLTHGHSVRYHVPEPTFLTFKICTVVIPNAKFVLNCRCLPFEEWRKIQLAEQNRVIDVPFDD